jgi:hypothetical protein
MRKTHFILSVFVVMIASCSKSSHHEDAPDNGCIGRTVVRQSDPLLTAAQIKTADSLLDVNHFAHNNYRYLGLRQDSLYSTFEQFITVDQYANGLRLFTSQINYLFWNGIIHYTSGAPTQGTTLDTIPSLGLARLRTLFSGDLKKHELGGAGGSYGAVSYGFRDSCYKAEFGYINIAADGAPEDLIKAWRVSVKRTPDPGYPNDLPYAIYKDSNGQLIAFVGNIISID